jgi:hypothetical protein
VNFQSTQEKKIPPKFDKILGCYSFGDGLREFVYGACLGRSFGTSSNVEPAHNTTKILCPNLQ